MSRILMILAVIIAIPVIFMLGLLLLLDSPDYYRQQLAVTVQEQTGFELSIKGDLNWRYWPPIAIEITDVEIRLAGASTPLAKFNAAAVDLKLLPLLTGSSTLAVNGIFIDGLQINAVIDARGNANWEVSSDTTTPATLARDAPAVAGTATSSDKGIDLDITKIIITNSVINYENRSTNSHYKLDLHSFTTGSVSFNQPIEIQFDIGFEDVLADIRGTTTGTGRISFDNDFNRYTFSQLQLHNKVKMPAMAPLDLSLTINGFADLSAGTASLENTSFQMAELKGALSLDVKDLNNTPKLSGRLQVSPFNAKALLLKLNRTAIKTANPNALTNVSFSTNINGTTADIILDSIEATIDNSELKGRAELHLGDKINVRFDLEMDRIIASDYLPVPVAGVPASANAGKPSTTRREDSEVLPVDLLDEVDFRGVFSLQSLTYDRYTFTDLTTQIANAEHQLTVNLTALGYDGELKLDFEARSDRPSGKTSLDISGLNISKLTEFEWITGTLNLNSTTSFKGSKLSDVLASLNGTNRFSIDDGTLDVTPIKQVAALIDRLSDKSSGISAWPDQLPFEKLHGQHTLDHGIAADQQLNLQLENVTITGHGGVDYWQNTLLYDLNIVFEESADGPFQVSPLIAGVRWPLHCEGAMDASPETLCRPDHKAIETVVADLIKREFKRQGREKIARKIEEKIPDKLKEKAKKLLQGLFDR